MTEPVTVNKDIIDGSPVVHREQAKIFTPLSKYADGMSPTYGVDKCVLEDARVVYQCVHPDPPEDCEYWHLNGVSVRSHLVVHTRATRLAQEAQVRAKLAELEQREAQRKENYRNGALRGAANRRLNRAKARMNGDDNGEDQNVSMTPKEYQKKIDSLQTSLDGAADGLSRMGVVLTNITKTLENAVAGLEDLAAAAPEPDPVLVEKARDWDAMQALLKGKR